MLEQDKLGFAFLTAPTSNTSVAQYKAIRDMGLTMSVLSGAVKAEALTVTKNFPYYQRISPSQKSRSTVMVNLVTMFGWRRVSLLWDSMGVSVEFA
jgi:hypothetical protein